VSVGEHEDKVLAVIRVLVDYLLNICYEVGQFLIVSCMSKVDY